MHFLHKLQVLRGALLNALLVLVITGSPGEREPHVCGRLRCAELTTLPQALHSSTTGWDAVEQPGEEGRCGRESKMTGGPEETLRQRHGGQGTDTQAGFVPAQLGTRYLHKISSQDIYRRYYRRYLQKRFPLTK